MDKAPPWIAVSDYFPLWGERAFARAITASRTHLFQADLVDGGSTSSVLGGLGVAARTRVGLSPQRTTHGMVGGSTAGLWRGILTPPNPRNTCFRLCGASAETVASRTVFCQVS